MEKTIKERHLHIEILMYLVGFLDLFGVSLIIPLLSKHVRFLGASPSMAGALGSVYGGLQLWSSPVVGNWSDLSGRRYVLIWCLLMTSASYALIGGATSLLLIFVARIPTGVFKHSQNIAKAYLSDITPKHRHSLVFGRFSSASSMGFIVGPVIGGHIAEWHDGIRMVAMTAGAIFLLNAVLVWAFCPEPASVPATNQNNSAPSKTSRTNFSVNSILQHFYVINWKDLWDIFLIRFFLGFAVLIYRSNFVLMLDYKFQTSPKMNGYIISYSGIVGTICGFFVGKIANFYKNDAKLLLHLSTLLIFVILGLTFSPNIWCLLFFLTPLSLINTVARVCVTNLTIEKGSSHDTGALLGLGQSIMSGARTLSPFLGGVAGEISILGPGLVGAVSATIGVLLQIVSPQDIAKKTQ